MNREAAVDAAAMVGAPLIVLGLVVGYFFYTQATIQSALDRRFEQQLRTVFPNATRFSDEQGDTPHFKAYTRDAETGEETLIGLAFHTFELDVWAKHRPGFT